MSQREGEARVQSQREKVSVSTRANIPIPFPFGARLTQTKLSGGFPLACQPRAFSFYP